MKIIPLTQGYETRVDDDIFELIGEFKWYAKFSRDSNEPYAVRTINFKDGRKIQVRLHRFIMDTPDYMECHHKDDDRLNNQRYNLENVTKTENLGARWKKRQYKKG